MNAQPLPSRSMLAVALAMALDACQSGSTRVTTEADSTAIASAIEGVWRNMMAGAQALDPDRIRASYVEQPVVVINGRIIPSTRGPVDTGFQALGSGLVGARRETSGNRPRAWTRLAQPPTKVCDGVEAQPR